jgi:hypothetical protein
VNDRPTDEKAGLTSGQKSWQTNLARHGRAHFERGGAAGAAERNRHSTPAERRAWAAKGAAAQRAKYSDDERREWARMGNAAIPPEKRRERAKKASAAAHAARKAKEAAHAAEVAALKQEVARLKARLGETP